MRSGRATQGAVVATSIFVAIMLLLIAANFAPFDRQCAWQFPKIASCLLSARETLVAGLVAAGGALFAAWLAWSAIRDQIDFDAARDAAVKEDMARSKIKLAKIELSGLTLTADHIDKFIRGFKGVDASSEWNYVDDLRKLAKGGVLSLYSQPLPLPFAGQVGYLANKMKQLADKIKDVDTDRTLRHTDAPAAVTPELRREYIALDRAIKEALDEYAALRQEFRIAIAEREAIVAG
jgi:hypothetical protein